MDKQRQDEYLNQSSSPAQLEDLSEEDLQAYCQFLIEILQATSENKGDAEVVDRLFKANTDKLDHIFAEILRRWATNIFEEVATDEVETDAAQFAPAVIVKFGNLIQQFSLGNKASNMEIAITIKSNIESNHLTTETLNQLTNISKELSQKSLEYTRSLRNLKDYQNTIDINRNNYQEKLRQISAATQYDNLSILKTFDRQDCNRFYKQINADIGYFEQGSSLLDQATASIRGIVEIEQTKREQRSLEAERNLNTTINTLGIGFGGGAIISGVVVQYIDKIKQAVDLSLSLNKPLHPFYASLFISIAATLFFSVIGWLISRRK